MIDMIGHNMSQWAALIGHEVAHLTLDHTGKQVDRSIKNMVLQVITYGVVGNGRAQSPGGPWPSRPTTRSSVAALNGKPITWG